MQSTRRYSEKQYADGLESWRFLKLRGKKPLFTSPFGDVFLTDRKGIWFLDTIGGTLKLIAKNETDLAALLASDEGEAEYLMVSVAQLAEDAGLVPEDNQVYDFNVPPALGGPMDLSNLGVLDFVVKLNIAGQIQGQVRKLKPGTKISGISIDGAKP